MRERKRENLVVLVLVVTPQKDVEDLERIINFTIKKDTHYDKPPMTIGRELALSDSP